jgi:pre-mRNA-processing factor 6
MESKESDARVILSRAVEVIPQSVELWLALARTETPDKAKGVLNKARKAVPTSHEIWIAAGRLLEQEDGGGGGGAAIDRTIEAAVATLRKHQVHLTRQQWLGEAERCEAEGSPRTCEAIVKATIALDVEEDERLDTWVGHAEEAEQKGCIGTARAILAYALKVFPDKRDLWWKAALLEKARGSR